MRRVTLNSCLFPALSLALATAALSALLPSCAKAMQQGAFFSGSMYPTITPPSRVEDHQAIPQDYELIGTVDASCEQRSGEHEREIVNSVLADGDCNEARLIRALRERVSEVGGTSLVGRQCGSETKTEEKTENKDGKQVPYQVTVNQLSCRAGVARPISGTPKTPIATVGETSKPRSSAPSALPALPAPPASSAPVGGISIRITKTAGSPSFPPRKVESVDELPAMPPSSIRLADIIARCEQNCTRPAVQNSLREAAARIGAGAVTDVKCVADGPGWLCTGIAITTQTSTASP